MFKEEERRARGLLRSVSTDGARWLFAILPDHGWEITRNGDPIAAGTGGRASIEAGVGKFLSLTPSRTGPGCLPRPVALAALSA